MPEVTSAICKHFAGRENGVAVGVSAKHPAQHSTGDGEIGRPKKNPGDADRGVSGEAGEKSSREIVSPCFVFEESANNPFDHEIGTMKQSPNDERPGRAVPETAQKHDDHQI